MDTATLAVTAAVIAVAAAAVAAAAFRLTRARTGGGGPRLGRPGRRTAAPAAGARSHAVTLDLDGVDAGSPSVQRLVHEVAGDLLSRHSGLWSVEVRDRTGRLLGVVERPEPSAGGPADPPGPRGIAASVRPTGDEPDLELRERDPGASASIPDRFELPPAVADRLPPEADLADLLRALLEASGRDVWLEDDVLRTGEEAVVVLERTHPDALSAGYLRFRRSGARRGLAVALRDVPPHEVARRERLDPDLRYGGPRAIQRMADAVAMGADPLRFAAGPPVLG